MSRAFGMVRMIIQKILILERGRQGWLGLLGWLR